MDCLPDILRLFGYAQNKSPERSGQTLLLKLDSGVRVYFFLALAFFLAFFFAFFPELHPHVLHICQSFHTRR